MKVRSSKKHFVEIISQKILWRKFVIHYQELWIFFSTKGNFTTYTSQLFRVYNIEKRTSDAAVRMLSRERRRKMKKHICEAFSVNCFRQNHISIKSLLGEIIFLQKEVYLMICLSAKYFAEKCFFCEQVSAKVIRQYIVQWKT